jgi:hypothetical protein
MRAQYFVVDDGDAWRVLYEFKKYGPYGDGSRQDALRAAIESAHEAGQRGFDAEVLIADGESGYRPVWRHGRDRYPPHPSSDDT